MADTDLSYASLNAVDGGEGERRYKQDGSPLIPAIMIDGEVFNFQHPSQIASLLELDVEGSQPSTAVAWSLLDVLQRWVEVIRDVPFPELLAPTPSRDRTIRNLTVNVFRPIAYLPQTWIDHQFNWYTNDADLQQESFLRTTEQLVSFAAAGALELNGFLLDHGDDLSERDPTIDGNRGEMPYSALLVTQRFHAAFHYRQIVDHLRNAGVAGNPPLPEAMVKEIGLPPNLY